MDWPSGGGVGPIGPGGVPHGRLSSRPGRRGSHGAPVPAGDAFVPFPIEAIERSVGDRFEEQARATRDRLAVKMPGRAVTLPGAGSPSAADQPGPSWPPGPAGPPVAILMEKDAPNLAAIFGVLGAGSPYVPLSASLTPGPGPSRSWRIAGPPRS